MREVSQEEQNLVIMYVLDRPLNRPDTNIKKGMQYTILYFLVVFLVTGGTYFVFEKVGIFKLSNHIENYKIKHPNRFLFIWLLVVFCIITMFSLKKIAIGCIKMYQHYAPEKIRRRCLCKPTCSEYAIIVIQKYGFLIGMKKIYIRLFKTCKGGIYHIDAP